ncbi:MAG: tRNA (adenosine(37)-N6)-dimethylallyltransferase MiaA [Acidiferrobacter sp.]
MSEHTVVFLMGPTGAGKTAAVLSLSERLPIDVISVDAAQIYRHLDIGTAKPSLAERRRAPHQLIDIRNVTESYSAAVFATAARGLIAVSHRNSRIPVLVGGSSFYFNALEHGLPSLPPADPALRAALTAQAAERGWPALHRELSERDPQAAARIHPTDPQRILRALEVIRLGGTIPPRVHGLGFPFRLVKLALAPPERAVLHRRIAARFHHMLAHGLIDEAAWLYEQRLGTTLPAMRLVGYRQVGEYLKGKIQYTELVERGVAATRQLAKRQLTWLRADPDVEWLDSTQADIGFRCAARIETAMAEINSRHGA